MKNSLGNVSLNPPIVAEPPILGGGGSLNKAG